MTVATATPISVEAGCDHAECATFAWPLHRQLSDGYEVCAAAPIVTVDEWRAEHRTARKRADRAHRRGYTFTAIQRHERADEIHAINISARVRQGRPMTAGYRDRPSETPLPDYPCARHGVRTYGVETADGDLVAYLWLYRAGQLGLVSQILGHADHLENEIMYLLWQGTLEREARQPDGYLVYNRWDSGTEGLRFFKERVGLARTEIEWRP